LRKYEIFALDGDQVAPLIRPSVTFVSCVGLPVVGSTTKSCGRPVRPRLVTATCLESGDQAMADTPSAIVADVRVQSELGHANVTQVPSCGLTAGPTQEAASWVPSADQTKSPPAAGSARAPLPSAAAT
jgi:hypothetical protein